MVATVVGNDVVAKVWIWEKCKITAKLFPGQIIVKGRGGKSASDEDEQTCMEENDQSKGKKASPWQRVKWTDIMVRLMITSVSYISEEAASEYGGGVRRKYANLQKKVKWKLVSKVMAQRGHFVSPQHCEDKFNDLNNRYKRLNEILGRGTCEVVENPMLLDMMDHIPTKTKEEVQKILSSEHLHYEEMCSYHNGNRLHLSPDPELQHSLRKALRSRDDNEQENANADINQVPPEGMKENRFFQKKDRELEMMRLEIKKMKLENERMAFELR
ncbi:sequence-specific DNA binding transcription factor [Abeliophyllum distichum]|uniref:Sequence-specific DNA binding transcription factor n=1 Tax=Abeliophyllum distichum TaxID=126358 RepID=A0ABD1SSL5_9LAMI